MEAFDPHSFEQHLAEFTGGGSAACLNLRDHLNAVVDRVNAIGDALADDKPKPKGGGATGTLTLYAINAGGVLMLTQFVASATESTSSSA